MWFTNLLDRGPNETLRSAAAQLSIAYKYTLCEKAGFRKRGTETTTVTNGTSTSLECYNFRLYMLAERVPRPCENIQITSSRRSVLLQFCFRLEISIFVYRKFISVTSLEVKSRLGPRRQQRHRVRDTVLGSQGDEVSAVQPRTRHSSWI